MRQVRQQSFAGIWIWRPAASARVVNVFLPRWSTSFRGLNCARQSSRSTPEAKVRDVPRSAWSGLLRIHFLQHWFNLSDPAMEEALYESRSMRRFVGTHRGREPAPDETTVFNKLRYRLEAHNLGKIMAEYLQENGIKVGTGTIVDATIIQAPSSTKNREQARDPEMHSTKKGNQWYFGMKAHIGVDSRTKLIHSVAATAANVHDSRLLPDLLHGEETRVWGDSAYSGQGETIRKYAPKASDFTNRKGFRNRPLSAEQYGRNRTKSKVEHPFLVIKRIFGFTKVRYRGLEKNATRLFVTCALANL